MTRRVTLLYVDGCPNWRIVDQRLSALRGDHDITVEHRRLSTVEEAEQMAFRGSPTVLIDGTDAFAGGDGQGGLSCRLYATEVGPRGAPSLEQLHRVLHEAGQARD